LYGILPPLDFHFGFIPYHVCAGMHNLPQSHEDTKFVLVPQCFGGNKFLFKAERIEI